MNKDAELRKDVFAWYGSAAYAAQLFEVELVTLMLCHEKKEKPEISVADIDDLDSKLSKKTMGQLIHDLNKRFTLTDRFKNTLIGYRDQRNYLAHEFFYSNGSKLLSPKGCQELIQELQSKYANLKEADRVMSEMSSTVRKESGINEQEFMLYVNQELDKIKKNA